MSVLQEAMFISGYSFISINQRSAGLIITIIHSAVRFVIPLIRPVFTSD